MSFDKDLIKPLCLKIVVAGQILRIQLILKPLVAKRY